MSITVCTVSGKGGTGKSTVSSGLAIAAAETCKSVLLIDLDCGLRCLDIMFGIEDRVVFDLADAIGEHDINKAVYKSLYYDNIYIVPAPMNMGEIDFLKLRSLIMKARADYDMIILDFPAGADFDNYNLFGDAAFLVVSGADPISTRDAAVISGGIRSSLPPRLIINRFDVDLVSSGIFRNVDEIINSSMTRLIGIVPADGELLLFSHDHKLKPKGRALKAFKRIIKRLAGEDVRLPNLKKI